MEFQREFYTTENGLNRVEISVRDGFPGPFERRVCESVAEYLSNQGGDIRIIELFNDDTNGCVGLTLATVEEEEMETDLDCFFTRYWGGRMIAIDIQLIAPGPTWRDHYNHGAYLREMVKMKLTDREAYEQAANEMSTVYQRMSER